MNKQEKLKEILFSEFDKLIEGSDIYDHRGSKWIIFTNEKRWVVEFTKEKTLWFNYHRFNEVMVLFAMDCNEDRNYIKEWYERRFIFNHKVKNGVTGVFKAYFERRNLEDTIQNGVKSHKIRNIMDAKDTIQNGVKRLWGSNNLPDQIIEETIQDGVKITKGVNFISDDCFDDIIQNGVNVISWAHPTSINSNQVDDIIQNGVKC
jgi:hypothetical protein